MQILRRVGLALVWFAGALFVFAAANKNDPYLISLRGWGNIALVVTSIAVAMILIRRGYWRKGIVGRALVLLWCLPALSMLGAHAAFEWQKQRVLQANASEVRNLGRHFVVGYSSFPEISALAEKGLISGVYITKHNIAGSSAARLKEEISALQEKRRAAGLPPLIVAADQEGGIVSHLAPPLTKLPALSTLANLPPDVRAEKAEAFGRTHGQELAALGVNLNLAPVLDLRPELKRNRFDFNTLIGQRAISNVPAVVADIARAYVSGLEASGIGATVKHFPGLGRVRTDTHHFTAELDTPVDELEASDWIPFRKVLAGSKAQLMVGHVTLTSVDPDRPASHSKRVVDGIIRKKWNFQGIVMTDDLVMGAIYQRDVCTAVVEALNAGVDLLLVAFDGTQFYRIFTCAMAASVEGRVEAAMMGESDLRLKVAFPVD
ncbi:glycoside hydrolase family 3 N-terminal domain-containing protein [Bradyrhizobium sp. CB3481]|uniref:glycoside hydrolase family 3 N-terminal domain-containing protein n=1 Tax=Bradyrhizobium sp. CB3481 TaxID=3039158 RepID=UPI0024B1F6DA|nr:glycoside hydrolase family 3 N-terminal domain-containing protein [Bradyrhizobium sp. CB3481]WFU20443.1 glycoside hydrolase family 3 N-terminal domain-containing protein [Bradyrhizobium sp. CB3481]